MGGRVGIEAVELATAPEDVLREVYELSGELHDELAPGTYFPSWGRWLTRTREVEPWSKPLHLLAREGGQLVAVGSLDRTYVETNRHLSWVGAEVRAPWRRQGRCRALLAELVAAAADDERTVLGAGAIQGTPGDDALPHLGFERKLVERMSRCSTAGLDRALLEGWVADAATAAAGYELLAIDGRIPDDQVEAFLDLETVMNTAPRDDFEVEDFIPDVERFRLREGRALARGDQPWLLVARERETGEWAAFTELYFVADDPVRAWQHGTGVRPSHRGRGLGRWLKAVNALRLLDERPEVGCIDTWNAGSNQHMLAINVAMGFEVVMWNAAWQAPLEQVRQRVAASG